MTKICIVTGASQGLGRGIAKVLAEEESATVYATARSKIDFPVCALDL